MINAGEMSLSIFIYNIEAFPMPKYIYFQTICEINSFIT